MSIIALTTDYGTRDAYVASVKGVILGIAPQAMVVDVTHDIAPQDIQHAAFALWQALPWFPPGTIHVVVVDPGVGTSRRILAAKCHGQVILAPDNGLLTFAFDEWPPDEVREVTNERFLLDRRSATFHGRDILAPVAAHLHQGALFADVGSVVATWERLPVRLRAELGDEELRGTVIHVDHFGNLVTNIRRAQFAQLIPGNDAVVVEVSNNVIRHIGNTFADAAAGELVAYFGSSDLLEIGMHGGSAAARLNVARGAALTVRRAG